VSAFLSSAPAGAEAPTVQACADPAAAFAAARERAGEGDRIVVFGSFLTVASVLQSLGRKARGFGRRGAGPDQVARKSFPWDCSLAKIPPRRHRPPGRVRRSPAMLRRRNSVRAPVAGWPGR